MPKCKIHAIMVPHDWRQAAGSAHVEYRCETHGYGMQFVSTGAAQDGLCPIGRIEDATEKALAEIEAARR